MTGYLNLHQLRHRFADGTTAVDDVTLSVAQAEVHCLIGRSGCGKTTLLKLAAGLLAPSAGQVMLDGETVSAPTTHMGFVFQSATLLDWLTVQDNVLLPIALHRRVTESDHAQAQQLLEQVGLLHLQSQRPQQLSGGQQSRVAMARALITRPHVLFMDEPFAALDALTREELQIDFLRLCRQQGISVLFVTHDISEAVLLGHTVSVMHQGRITLSLPIALAQPRTHALRYSSSFNQLAAQLREAMQGGAP